ncbi:MAG: glycosyltransferase family 2 protein [Duncaniella sp.]|nr:glycosyltransferase family 2 protein [Duncaniella sp.]
MTVEVLISCMHQSANELITRSNIQSDVLVINQCDENSEERFEFVNHENKTCIARVINTTERGLSKSRNLAIKNAIGDICLLCDDDEILENDYVYKIKSAFNNHPNFSVISFRFNMPSNYYMTKTFWNESKVINYKTALKISSWQIAFRKKDITLNNIHFDEKIGSGVTKAGGEEKIFLHNCLSYNLKVMYVPITIGNMTFQASQWVDNIFSPEYFIDWGYYTKRLKGGSLGATILSLLFAIKKHPEYTHKCSFHKAFTSMLKGIYLKK